MEYEKSEMQQTHDEWLDTWNENNSTANAIIIDGTEFFPSGATRRNDIYTDGVYADPNDRDTLQRRVTYWQTRLEREETEFNALHAQIKRQTEERIAAGQAPVMTAKNAGDRLIPLRDSILKGRARLEEAEEALQALPAAKKETEDEARRREAKEEEQARRREANARVMDIIEKVHI